MHHLGQRLLEWIQKQDPTVCFYRKPTLNINAHRDHIKQQELTFTAGQNATWYSHFGKQFGTVYESFSHGNPMTPNSPPGYTHPTEIHTYFQLKICKNGLRSTICKQPQTRNCPNAYQ